MSKQPKAANKTNIKGKTKAKTKKVLDGIRHEDRTHTDTDTDTNTTTDTDTETDIDIDIIRTIYIYIHTYIYTDVKYDK